MRQINLLSKKGNSFFITKGKNFLGTKFSKEQINDCFDFAYDMTFGKTGEHRKSRSGGQYSRKNGELFGNTFQGKLAEFAFYNFLVTNQILANEPDLSKWGLGQWDECDFNINEKKISVKSASFFSNLLLLEVKDWNNAGAYIPNNMAYDYHVLSRIKPDIKGVLTKNKLFYVQTAEKKALEALVKSYAFEYDIAGFLTLNSFKSIIVNGMILPQNALLNGKVNMDAENYYCQAGDLETIESIVNQLR